MANVKVMRTDGKEADFLQEFPNALRLHLVPKIYKNNGTENKEIGDYLTNENHENMYAIIVKDDISEKNIPEAIHLGIIQLFTHLTEDDKKPEVILMDYYELGSYKSQAIFLCILKELMLTYFGEAFKDEITLIIYNCKKEDISVMI